MITQLDENGELVRHFDNAEEMFKIFNEEFKVEHPFFYWFDEFWYRNIDAELFGYAPHVLLQEPWVILDSVWDEVRWAYQRVSKGYDDRATWGIGYWLGKYVPKILGEMKGSKVGIPMTFFDDTENTEYSDAEEDTAAKRYDEVIMDLKKAFEEMVEMEEYKFDWENKTREENLEEYNIKMKSIKDRMKKLIDYYWELGD
jgi:hypothetical protein